MRTYPLENDAFDRPISRRSSASSAARIIDFIFSVVYSLLAVRFALVFFHASEGSGFTRFIGAITDPLYAPFRGIVQNGQFLGYTVAWSIVVALLAYALLHTAIGALVRMLARRA